MPIRFSRQKYPTNAAWLADELRTAIARGELRAGDQIVQEELAATYKVSRMPVREALQQLRMNT